VFHHILLASPDRPGAQKRNNMKSHCLKKPRKDSVTGEWFWNGLVYPEYPTEAIEKYEAELEDYWEARREDRKLHED